MRPECARARLITRGALALACVLGCAGGLPAQSRIHRLPLTPENVHWGYYDARLRPVLRIASGDTVYLETSIGRGLEWLRQAGVPDDDIPESIKAVDRAVTDRGPGGHLLQGPIYVDGAEPGDVLEVHILDVQFLHPYGIKHLGETTYRRIPIDVTSGTAEFSGTRIKMAPFWGNIGVAPPAEMGRISSAPAGIHTGNIDHKDIGPGSILYVPVLVPGALLSIGDGHAVQGDGEITGSALETSLKGSVRVVLRKGQRWKWPRAETPTHFITMGIDTDLNKAAAVAVEEMIDYLVTEKRLSRENAAMLCAFVVDLRISRQAYVVSAYLPKAIFPVSAAP